MKISNTDELNSWAKELAAEVAEASSADVVEKLRVRVLGRKGELTGLLRGIKDMDPKERGSFGKRINEIKGELEQVIEVRKGELEREVMNAKLEKEWVDVTVPTSSERFGALHPLTRIRRELLGVFETMGFEVADGPEMDREEFNFETLNIPEWHPARDMWDTFWVNETMESEGAADAKDGNAMLLRTHTSNLQVRYLREFGAPARVISPGRCFRYEATDATHENTLNQIEGFVVDEGITMANLISTLKQMLGAVFQDEVELRLRPSYFPFVEPGVEVDMRCVFCGGDGCKSCQHAGWLEMLGAGMIHPFVLRAAGLDPEKVSGFAFGMGMDRLAMMRYGIDDVRRMNSGEVRFSKAFSG